MIWGPLQNPVDPTPTPIPPRRPQKAKVLCRRGPRSFPRKVQLDALTQDTFRSQFRNDFEDFSTCLWKALLLLFALFPFKFRTRYWCNVQLFSCFVGASLGHLCLLFLLAFCMLLLLNVRTSPPLRHPSAPPLIKKELTRRTAT